MFVPSLYLVGVMACVYTGTVDSYKILGFFPLNLYSHHVPFFNVFDELVTHGHEVTLVSHYPLQHTSSSRYTYIQLRAEGDHFNARRLSVSNAFHLIRRFSRFCIDSMHKNLQMPQVKDFIQNHTGQFDVIVAEVTFCGHIHAALAHKYNAPLVNFNPLGYESSQFSLFGAMALPGAAVDVRAHYTDQSRSLWHRANDLFIMFSDMWDFHSQYLPEMDKLVEVYNYPGSESRPPLLSLLRNISLTLVESDPKIIGLSIPVPANVILTGGLHLRPAKPLTKNLEQFMQAPGKKGVIFASLGTILEFSDFGEEIVKAYAAVFKELEYNVIWKIDVNMTLPDHIMTGTWFPQEDILGHPNCKLFITHGGIHSTMEAVYYAVPVLVMPGFVDQFQNAQMMEEKGIGLVTLAETITSDTLLVNIYEVLRNPKYRSSVQRISKHVHSLPYHNLDVAVRWIEYVAENQGAPGLSPEARHSSIWQLLSLDVLLSTLCLLIFAVMKLILIVYGVYRLCRRGCRGSSQKSE